MKILFGYSKIHFDPSRPPSEHKYWHSSASILARSFYACLQELGEVTYVDVFKEAEIRHGDFDIYVGIVKNFTSIVKLNGIGRSVLIAVNMHSAHRNALLKTFMRRNNIPNKAAVDYDFNDELADSEAYKSAEAILCFGNVSTLNSFIAKGTNARKIKLLNYGIESDTVIGPLVRDPRAPVKFLYVASEIGLRKGFDVVAQSFAELRRSDTEFMLGVVGRPTNTYYEEKLNGLEKSIGDNFKYYGWLDSASKEYDDVLRSYDYIVFPSIEEGQAGTVLDALQRGLIPILSKNTGIDFSPLGHFELDVRSDANVNLLKRASQIRAEDLCRLRDETLDYYQQYHSGFVSNIRAALVDVFGGQLYPKLSIVLPIFNKQKSIVDLLGYLHTACLRYSNIELHVIFDGCSDGSERAVKDFFENKKLYPVTYEVTPDIFEVKTNNIGLRKSQGRYCAVMQDDTYIYNDSLFLETVNFLEKNSKAVILGTLAGVNFYPRGTTGLVGKGQISCSDHEVYWRQDHETDPTLKEKIYEVDACMRGPLFFRKSFLEDHGYLDEVYAPLYQDDMDICARARSLGYKVFCLLGDVENKSLTMANYDAAKWQKFEAVMRRNLDIFYDRWTFSVTKNYSSIDREPWAMTPNATIAYKIDAFCRYSQLVIKSFLRPARAVASKVKHGALALTKG